VDGSVMISYAADSHGFMVNYIVGLLLFANGSMLEIREWDTNKPLGEIPQVERIILLSVI
jgi:hypothetical protein